MPQGRQAIEEDLGQQGRGDAVGTFLKGISMARLGSNNRDYQDHPTARCLA